MRLSDILRGHEQAARIFMELVEVGAITLGPSGFKIQRPPMSAEASEALRRLSRGQSDVIEAYSYGKLLSEGVKIFRPRLDQLEMLEQTRLNLPMADYAQPYPTLVVEFPEAFYRKKIVHCPQEGEWYYGKAIKADHEPGYAIVRHELDYIMVTLTFSSELSIKTCIRDAGEDLEASIEGFTGADGFQNSMTITVEEWAVVKSCVRSALNYCLLLDEVGHRQERPLPGLPNPRKCSGSWVTGTFYELSQEVALHRAVANESELPHEDTGRTMPPHHRRGHYRFQRYGEGRQQRKRIRIAPVFVNSHLFLGKMSDTRATYR